jgi:hypothetical protein
VFSAHVVFGDIDRSSALPMVERVRVIETFRSICSDVRPGMNSHSFYDIDNDSLMAGFSDLHGLTSGNEVIEFVLSLRRRLLAEDISVSFGANLVACSPAIHWNTYPGLKDDLRLIHMPDDAYNKLGGVSRSRLTGDVLIVAARMLSLSKALNTGLCVSTFRGGKFNPDPNYDLRLVDPATSTLKPEYAQWLVDRGIEAFEVHEAQ